MTQLNQTIFLWLYGLSGHNVWLDSLVRFSAVYLPWLIFIFLAWRLIQTVERGQSTKFFSALTLALVLTLILGWLIKTLNYQARPFATLAALQTLVPHSADATFPSLHSAALAALATVAWPTHRVWGRNLAVAAFLVGLARIMAGLHWPLDVLGGWALGVLVGACLIWAFRYNRQNQIKS